MRAQCQPSSSPPTAKTNPPTPPEMAATCAGVMEAAALPGPGAGGTKPAVSVGEDVTEGLAPGDSVGVGEGVEDVEGLAPRESEGVGEGVYEGM